MACSALRLLAIKIGLEDFFEFGDEFVKACHGVLRGVKGALF